MSALLPQPNGFEGLFPGRVLAAPCDLSVADREDVSEELIRFDTAELGASAESLDRDHRVATGVDQLHQLEAEPVERVDPVLEVCPQGALAMDRTAVVDLALDRPVVDIVGELLKYRSSPPRANAS